MNPFSQKDSPSESKNRPPVPRKSLGPLKCRSDCDSKDDSSCVSSSSPSPSPLSSSSLPVHQDRPAISIACGRLPLALPISDPQAYAPSAAEPSLPWNFDRDVRACEMDHNSLNQNNRDLSQPTAAHISTTSSPSSSSAVRRSLGMTYARRNKPSFGLLNRDPYKTPFFSFRTTSHKLHISPSSLDINGSSNTTNSSPSPSPTTPPTVIPTTWIPASTDLPDSDGNQSKRSFSIRLRPIEGEIDTQTLRSLFDAILPVRYNDQFYNAVCHINGQDMSLLAYWKDQCIGSICCRREPLSGPPHPSQPPIPVEELRRSPRCCRIYIMTLGVLAPFRRLRVGTALLNQMISTLTTDPSVDHICLHVQTSNEEALNFYRRHGFVVRSRIDGYYKQNPGVSPPDAYFLTLNV